MPRQYDLIDSDSLEQEVTGLVGRKEEEVSTGLGSGNIVHKAGLGDSLGGRSLQAGQQHFILHTNTNIMSILFTLYGMEMFQLYSVTCYLLLQ